MDPIGTFTVVMPGLLQKARYPILITEANVNVPLMLLLKKEKSFITTREDGKVTLVTLELDAKELGISVIPSSIIKFVILPILLPLNCE